MIESIHFENFRCFEDYTVKHLSRINLLVGANNAGKSSLLEGLSFLQTGNWIFLNNILTRRGWSITKFNQTNQFNQFINVKHSLFNSKALKQGGDFFCIEAKSASDNEKVSFKLSNSTPSGSPSNPNQLLSNLFLYQSLGESGLAVIGQTGLQVEFSNQAKQYTTPLIPLFDGQAVRVESFHHLTQFSINQKNYPKSYYIFPESNDLQSAISAWSQIAFQPDIVNKILEALKLTKPEIEGIQILQASPNTPANFYLKLEGEDEPYPLNALGDGSRRLLYLLLSFPLAKDGMVFVDEIETGIHYSLMKSMWAMIREMAQAYNVQVFATTHSFDCISGLANLYQQENADEISIHRIDYRKKNAVHYCHEEIYKAIELGEEIRGLG